MSKALSDAEILALLDELHELSYLYGNDEEVNIATRETTVTVESAKRLADQCQVQVPSLNDERMMNGNDENLDPIYIPEESLSTEEAHGESDESDGDKCEKSARKTC